MPDDSQLIELAGLVSELRAITDRLRSTAEALAAARTSGPGSRMRELARSALGELDRARRRGKEGGGLT